MTHTRCITVAYHPLHMHGQIGILGFRSTLTPNCGNVTCPRHLVTVPSEANCSQGVMSIGHDSTYLRATAGHAEHSDGRIDLTIGQTTLHRDESYNIHSTSLPNAHQQRDRRWATMGHSKHSTPHARLLGHSTPSLFLNSFSSTVFHLRTHFTHQTAHLYLGPASFTCHLQTRLLPADDPDTLEVNHQVARQKV
jgi:hypothetical protein